MPASTSECLKSSIRTSAICSICYTSDLEECLLDAEVDVLEHPRESADLGELCLLPVFLQLLSEGLVLVEHLIECLLPVVASLLELCRLNFEQLYFEISYHLRSF